MADTTESAPRRRRGPAPESGLLDKQQLAELLGVTQRSIERFLSKEEYKFPRPIRLGQRACLRWRRATIDAWIERREQIAQRA